MSKCVLFESIKTDVNGVDLNAEPSINSTFRGITIDSRVESENASDSIRFNDDDDSNEIDESDPQYEKQPPPRISTSRGIKIDSRFEDPNAYDSISFNDDDDSNKRMKAIRNLQNSVIQEFQLDMESQSR
jgi:hypothetical protein